MKPGRRVLTALLVAAPILAFLAVYLAYNPSPTPHAGKTIHLNATGAGGGCRYRLLYYDPLYLEHPNETLYRVISRIVRETGGCMDAYLGSRAGLRPLLHLDRYDIIVIRAHGGIWAGRGGFYFATGLSPSGPYDVPARLVERLASEAAIEAGSPAVFAGGAVVAAPEYIVVGAPFFEKVARLKKGAIVILESCDSMRDPRFVATLIRDGASLYIGWTGKVTPREIDDTLPWLLRLVVSRLHDPCSVAKTLAKRLIVAGTGSMLTAVCRSGG